MHESNLVLTIENESTLYESRLAIGRDFLVSGNRQAAVQSMNRLISTFMEKRSHLFSIAERQRQYIAEAAEACVDTVIEAMAESDAELSNAHDAISPLVKPASGDVLKPFELPVSTVKPDVCEVLRKSRVSGGKLYLPNAKLSPALYKDVNEVLVAMGGKWTAGKTQAHVFADVDPDAFAQCFEDLLLTGQYTNPKDVSFFPTPAVLAERIVGMADIQPGMRILEPSAGNGSIVFAAAAYTELHNITCVEIFPPNIRVLERAGLKVLPLDFLQLQPPTNESAKYDRIVMNPPFSQHQDAAHVLHACQFLKKTGRLDAITSTSWAHAQKNRKAESFKGFLDETDAQVINVPAGTFKSSGTMVATMIIQIEGENLPWYRHQAPADVDVGAVDAEMEVPAP